MAGVNLRGVVKKFGDNEVVHGIDLDITNKEFIVLVGPSGCGKSTLLLLSRPAAMLLLQVAYGGLVLLEDLVDLFLLAPFEFEFLGQSFRAIIVERRGCEALQDAFEDFVGVLSQVDVPVVAEVYPAGEAPIVGADGRALTRAIRARGQVDPVFIETIDELPDVLEAIVADHGNDALIVTRNHRVNVTVVAEGECFESRIDAKTFSGRIDNE